MGAITRLKTGLSRLSGIDDTPVDANIWDAISSNWAYDHAADLNAHIRDLREIWRTGTYMPSLLHTNDWNNVNTALTADTLYAMAYPVPRLLTVDRIGTYVGTAAAGKVARVGIYADNGNCYPSTLVIDGGEIALDTTGFKEVTISKQLTKGLYWTVIISNGAPGIYGTDDKYLGIFGAATCAHGFYAAWSVAQAWCFTC